MKQILLKSGEVNVHNVPSPCVDKKSILVRVNNSCISIGTELSGVKSSGESLLKRALKNPHHVRTVLSMAAESGVANVTNLVKKKLDAGSPLGYSAAGQVIEVGSDIKDIMIGDRVACSGAQCANHAEIICVPRILLVKIPDNISYEEASTVTLGAIALQGLRRASLTFGETAVVIGLGVIGQLLTQLLKANGINVIGIDLDETKVKLANESGAFCGITPSEEDVINKVSHITNGYGADSVIITASSASSEVISQAFNLCRKKAKVVLVGDVGLNIKREDMYEKELDLLISTSYGPGRYDPTYEEGGIDYPYHFVRWTENRNMEHYLLSLSKKDINLKKLLSSNTEIDNANIIYTKLATKNNELISTLYYPQRDESEVRTSYILNNKTQAKISKSKVSIGIVGAGSFAKGMHLPNLVKLKDIFTIKSIMSRSGHNAKEIARQYDANISSTNFDDLLKDKDLDSVLIATRHNLHGAQVLEAIKAGKHVLVEKPLTLSKDELEKIENFYSLPSKSHKPLLLTGFNRRFSPYMTDIKELVSKRVNPLIISYRMNAGHIPLDNWIHGEEGGGRNLGEACHIYDLFTFLISCKYSNIQVTSIYPNTKSIGKNDNFSVSISFEDGSIATLLYTSLGSKSYPKESMEIYMDGKVISMIDYKELNIYGDKVKSQKKQKASKGQYEELAIFGKSIIDGGDWPIPLWQQLQSTTIAFEIEEKIFKGDINDT